MEEFVARYRNASLLVAVLFVQFVLLGYQVKTGEDVRLVRVWTTALISPVEKILGNGTGVFGSLWNEYVWLRGTRAENETLQAENERLKLETQQLRRALARFSREEEILAYQQEILSETVLAQVTGVGSNPNAREVTVDKGRREGIKPGMAVITPDGVVGKVQAAHGSYSLVLLMNDADSGVGALLKNSRARGVLKGTGRVECRLEYIDTEVEVTIGETVYTSGEDRVFPRGLPVGEVTRVGAVSDYQEIYVRPYAALNRLDEVLVVTAGLHENLPRFATPQPPEVMMPMPRGVPDAVSSNGLSCSTKAICAKSAWSNGRLQPLAKRWDSSSRFWATSGASTKNNVAVAGAAKIAANRALVRGYRANKASNSSATMLVILIIGLIAGPAVSL